MTKASRIKSTAAICFIQQASDNQRIKRHVADQGKDLILDIL